MLALDLNGYHDTNQNTENENSSVIRHLDLTKKYTSSAL